MFAYRNAFLQKPLVTRNPQKIIKIVVKGIDNSNK